MDGAPRMLDRYAIGPKLGSGGFGTVYRARHTVLGTEVALKVLSPQHASSPEVLERFLREARAAASVGSPHIVTVHDAGVAEGVPFLAMELLSGEDLESRIARAGALSIAEAIEIGLQVLEGLDAAHRAGIVHRDMKPANVFLTERGGRPFVKLLDFGISKVVDPSSRRLTGTGTLLGTPAYMAPEQVLDMRNVDARADLYAVAVILFEALTGRLPHPADSFAELMARVQGLEPVPLERYLPSAPPALGALLARGMRADPSARFESAAHMARALAEVRAAPVTHGAFAASTGPMPGSPPWPLAHPPSAATPTPASLPPARSRSGPWLALAATGLLLPLACGGGVLVALSWTSDEPAPIATAPPPAPIVTPPPPPPPTLPSIPIPTPLPPPPPSAPRTTPDGRPIAAAIPSGADPCEVPLEYEVDCDREWEQREPETCESRGREMILVGSYGTGGPVVVEVARTAAPIVLVLHSYTATEWQLRLADGARLERVVAAGYMMGRVTGAPPGVPVETHDRSDGWPLMSFSWEGLNGHWSARELVNTAERELGLPARGWVGCYEPARVRIGQRAP